MTLVKTYEFLKECPFGIFELVDSETIKWTGSPTSEDITRRMANFSHRVAAMLSKAQPVYLCNVSFTGITGDTWGGIGEFEITTKLHLQEAKQ